MKYTAALLGSFVLVTFVHTHTDEIPVVLAMLGLLALGLGSFFPRTFLLSAVTLGLAPLAGELLVWLRLLHAPWQPTPLSSLPAIAAVCLALPCAGAGFGRLLRLK